MVDIGVTVEGSGAVLVTGMGSVRSFPTIGRTVRVAYCSMSHAVPGREWEAMRRSRRLVKLLGSMVAM